MSRILVAFLGIRSGVVEDWAGWGMLRRCEFDEFTLTVLLDLCRLYYRTLVSVQREDGSRNKECAAACTYYISKITECGVYTDVALVNC